MLLVKEIIDSLSVFDPLIKYVKDILKSVPVASNIPKIVSDIIPVSSDGSSSKEIKLYSSTSYPQINLISAYLVANIDNQTNNRITNIMSISETEVVDGFYKTSLNLTINTSNIGDTNGSIHIRYTANY